MLTLEIADCCKKLRLSSNIADMSDKIQAENHQEYLLKLLKTEIEHRKVKRKERLLKNAGFYTLKTFDSFKFDEVTLPSQINIEYLRNCKFIEDKTNLVMYGNVGTGKIKLVLAALAFIIAVSQWWLLSSSLVWLLVEKRGF